MTGEMDDALASWMVRGFARVDARPAHMIAAERHATIGSPAAAECGAGSSSSSPSESCMPPTSSRSAATRRPGDPAARVRRWVAAQQIQRYWRAIALSQRQEAVVPAIPMLDATSASLDVQIGDGCGWAASCEGTPASSMLAGAKAAGQEVLGEGSGGEEGRQRDGAAGSMLSQLSLWVPSWLEKTRRDSRAMALGNGKEAAEDEDEDRLIDPQAEREEATRLICRQMRKWVLRSKLPSLFKHELAVLRVTVCHARDLPNIDALLESDPYVTFQIHSKHTNIQRRTQVGRPSRCTLRASS